MLNKKRKMAMISLMMRHLERCYTEEAQDKELEEILALELFKALIYLEQKLTKGIFKAVTMAY